PVGPRFSRAPYGLLRQAMAALFFSWSHRLHYPIARDPGTTHLGRYLPRPRQCIHKKPSPRPRSVPALSLSRFTLGSLPAGPESLLHVRLLFLEHGPSRFSSQQHSAARGRWPAALSVTHPPIWQRGRPLG